MIIFIMLSVEIWSIAETKTTIVAYSQSDQLSAIAALAFIILLLNDGEEREICAERVGRRRDDRLCREGDCGGGRMGYIYSDDDNIQRTAFEWHCFAGKELVDVVVPKDKRLPV